MLSLPCRRIIVRAVSSSSQATRSPRHGRAIIVVLIAVSLDDVEDADFAKLGAALASATTVRIIVAPYFNAQRRPLSWCRRRCRCVGGSYLSCGAIRGGRMKSEVELFVVGGVVCWASWAVLHPGRFVFLDGDDLFSGVFSMLVSSANDSVVDGLQRPHRGRAVALSRWLRGCPSPTPTQLHTD
ncbi:hypothetical protein BDZ89DRAFT_1068272 [Hymenopellis radicata]|nr:hypothetical protein BDZ89DRAFT_1068272 [Hymenopellis radicata]